MDDERLWRLVPDPEACGDRVRHVAMCLDRYHRVSSTAAPGRKVRKQLVKRLGTDTARIAVFEKNERAIAGLSKGTIELV
jgi:hypothetical protein